MCQAGGRGSEKKKKKKNNFREGSLLLTLSRSRHAQLRDGLRLFCTFFLSVLHLDGSKSLSRIDMRRGKGGEAPEQRRNLKLVNGNRAFDSFSLSLSLDLCLLLSQSKLPPTDASLPWGESTMWGAGASGSGKANAEGPGAGAGVADGG